MAANGLFLQGLFWNQKQKKKLAVYAFDPEFVEYMAFRCVATKWQN